MNRIVENVLKYSCCYYRCYNYTYHNDNVYEQESSVISWENTKPFVPPIDGGIVIKVYDGDTITIAAKLPYYRSELYRFSVRLKGIDTPEIKSNNEHEKILAKKARDYLSNKILNKKVVLKNVSTEKYGRILADVYLDGININKLMLEQNYAVEYNGGTKSTF